ncbi:hypothetical protein B0T14DRAFT_521869 [Immersiella caudata]|uniref:Uncharacterized protein n=1 Tax=Immersiella caudata TaxID=314043 RepID=A0AA40C119_9PEZI|nr:hypothetical protein B0T14DRAFT_521869 [Immersiella caudata]
MPTFHCPPLFCWGRRKKASPVVSIPAHPETVTANPLVNPAPPPGAATANFDPVDQDSHSESGSSETGGEVNDTVDIPAQGFLKAGVVLPHYQTSESWSRRVNLSSEPPNVLLTINDVLQAIRQQCQLSRRILFETARLQRSALSMRSLTLSGEARELDLALVELDKVLELGSELIGRSGVGRDYWEGLPQEAQGDYLGMLQAREEQDSILETYRFKTTVGTVKKALLVLEKRVRDEVAGELKNVMISKGEADHKLLTRRVEDVESELKPHYQRVKGIYKECEQEVRTAAQARHKVEEKSDGKFAFESGQLEVERHKSRDLDAVVDRFL